MFCALSVLRWRQLVLLSGLVAACAGGRADPGNVDARLFADGGEGGDLFVPRADRGGVISDSITPKKDLLIRADQGIPPDLRLPDQYVQLDKSLPPDTKPVELCDNGKDDDGDAMVDCADLGDCAKSSPCVAGGRTLVIHEVYPGTPDYVVIRNASTTSRNIAGFRLEMFGTGQVNYTLPSKTLASGQTVGIFEYADGSGGDINTGANIPFYNGLTAQANAVVLKNAAGTVIDYVGFGSALTGKPTGITQSGGVISYVGYAVSTQSHHRARLKGAPPTVRASDWVVAKRSR